MKVLDLQCAHGHVFEGWFASEDDFQQQLSSHLLTCPMCADTSVTKLPSAPRLNLGAPTSEGSSNSAREGARQGAREGAEEPATLPGQGAALPAPAAVQAALMQAVRSIMANTEDVGEKFAEEARRIHYGEADERNIRGQATAEETSALLDEGIAVMPLPIPAGFKDTLQ